MNDYTKMVYVVQEGGWWSFTAKQWIAFFPLALARVRSGAGYELPDLNRLKGPPKCAKRIDEEDAWNSDRNDTEIFYLLGWDLEAWEEEVAIMRESGLLRDPISVGNMQSIFRGSQSPLRRL
jgi:hypothetical protein